MKQKFKQKTPKKRDRDERDSFERHAKRTSREFTHDDVDYDKEINFERFSQEISEDTD